MNITITVSDSDVRALLHPQKRRKFPKTITAIDTPHGTIQSVTETPFQTPKNLSLFSAMAPAFTSQTQAFKIALARNILGQNQTHKYTLFRA